MEDRIVIKDIDSDKYCILHNFVVDADVIEQVSYEVSINCGQFDGYASLNAELADFSYLKLGLEKMYNGKLEYIYMIDQTFLPGIISQIYNVLAH
ncbi:MAG: hypothetical protein NC115_01860 [Bacteroidales bacterium]|nr:hypothetical protein [Bacteroidales bacterium]